MIVSHAHRFIFLHGRKTAGTSIGISLMRFLGNDDIVRGYITGGLAEGVPPPRYSTAPFLVGIRGLASSLILWNSERKGTAFAPPLKVFLYRCYVARRFGVYKTHMTCEELKNLVGEKVWGAYFKFTFQRNPWDRMLSFYCWRTRDMPDPPAFNEFVNAVWEQDAQRIEQYNAGGFPNVLFYSFNQGGIAVDFIGQYDNLHGDLCEVFSRIGMSFDGWLPRNKSEIRARTNSPDYDTATKKMVADIANREVSDFGYVFPEALMKKNGEGVEGTGLP